MTPIGPLQPLPLAPPLAPLPPPAEYAVRVEEVNVRIGDRQVLDGVSFRVPRGGCTAIVGRNGAGKTTLLRVLLGLERPATGRVVVAPRPDGGRARIGWVPQRQAVDRGLPLTVRECFALHAPARPLPLGSARLRARALTQLAAVAAAGLIDRPLAALSGGELQRVLLALALDRQPDLLLLDEPDAGIDAAGSQLCCGLAGGLRRSRGFTQILVSHDLALVTAHADHVVLLDRAVLAEGPPEQVLTRPLLRRAFGDHLGLPDPHHLPDGVSGCPDPTHRH